MPSPVQAHSKAIWRDSALGALVGVPAPAYLVYDGPDVVLSAVGPEQLVFYQLDGDDYVLIDLTNPGVTLGDYHDVGGTLWTVPPDAIRLSAVTVLGDAFLY
jgi:hypothetical protein